MTPEVPEPLRVALLVVDALERLGVGYHIGGSWASSIHGVPRQTQDIDIVAELRPDFVGRLVAALGEGFYADEASARGAAHARTSFNLIHLDTGVKVDVFVRGDAPFDREEFARHRSEVVRADPECRAFVKSPEDTILRKLQWYRQGGETSDRQWGDVLGIVRTQGERLDGTYLRRWSEELGVGDLVERLFADRG
jgi:hypothetical protein